MRGLAKEKRGSSGVKAALQISLYGNTEEKCRIIPTAIHEETLSVGGRASPNRLMYKL